MVRRRRKPALWPRSFLCSAHLDLMLDKQARKRTMTKSQLIRHLLEKQLAFENVKGSDKLDSQEEGDA